LKNQEKKIGYVWYKIEYDGKTGYVSRNAVGNLSDINFKFIVKDGLPKKLFDESKTQEDSYIVPESETKGVNVSGKLKNKVRIKDGDINLSWNIDIEEMKKQNPEIVEYGEGLEKAKQGLRKSKYKL
jgi:SH3 domain protein